MQIFTTLGLDVATIIAQIINFGVLLAALSFFLYKPALRVIDERRARIQQSMDNAAKLEKHVQEMEKERKKRLKDIDAQAQTLFDESRQQADEIRKELHESAENEVKLMLEKGRKQLEDERRKMLAEVQKTATSISVQLAGKILQKEFGAEEQKKLMKDIEREMPSLLADSASA